MIRINLLSLSDKLDSKWEKINRIVVSSAVIIISVQFVFVSLIFVSTKYLEIENDSLDKQLENLQLGAKAKEILTMQKDIKEYGNHLECINQIQEEHLCWTKIVDSFSQIIPDQTKIKGISIKENKNDSKKKGEENEKSDSDKYKIVIQGESRKEDYLKHLLEFESNLKKSEMFELIVEDYLEKNYISDSDFEFRVLVDKNDVMAIKDK